jgi:ligand-binding sensor protein
MAEKVQMSQDDFPMLDIEQLAFHDVFDLEEIQEIQDTFAEATGVASIITDVDGVPITKPSNFCRMCQLVRSTELGQANCYQSDAEIGKPHPEGPIIQPCLSGGLWDGGVSIYLAGRHIANWLIGQVLEDDADVEKVIQYGEQIGADPAEFREAVAEVTRMPYVQFEQVGQALFVLANQLSKMALQNAQQQQELLLRKRAEREREQVAIQLSTASEIAGQVSAILDPDELLSMVIPLLKERF